jgi:selenocysteine-specific elongation factor
MKKYYTIGMAGHIDHGKTTLTKALTNMDTDRLKEEKERAISIEPGYAPFHIDNEWEVSIVDVPGHEKFIRQMIAGVAGIDAVILVIAADEGVMPQTKEHLQILDLLGVSQGMIVFTKSEGLEEDMEELLKEDAQHHTAGTFLEKSPVYFVDSISLKNISALRKDINTMLEKTPQRRAGSGFRMPVDQSFTVKGQGTVVRGTIFNGSVNEGDNVQLLPQNKAIRIRQIQVHHEKRFSGRAGQRAALNLGGVDYDDISRGDVIVKGSFPVTKTIDIALQPVDLFTIPLKQRSPVKIHTGTSEVYGTIVFFDRNELNPGEKEEILCQIRLDQEIVADRNDRFILRRPTPAETIGGGRIIDPFGGKYRFGKQTVQMLNQKKEGTPEERLVFALQQGSAMTAAELAAKISISTEELEYEVKNSSKLMEIGGWLLTTEDGSEMKDHIKNLLAEYHSTYPMRPGKNVAELIKSLPVPEQAGTKFLQYLEKNKQIIREAEFVYLPEFTPSYPKPWARRMEQVENSILKSGMEVPVFEEAAAEAGLDKQQTAELYNFFLRSSMYKLDEKHLISESAVKKAVSKLKTEESEKFTLQDAKQHLGLSRKYLVPLLELFDKLQFTKREEEYRVWKN